MADTSGTPGKLAARWAGFGTSIFTEMTELARARGAVNLAQGFPDFHGPEELLRAIAAHVETSHHQYAPGNGEERLRRAVARFVAATTGVERDWATEVTITTGATEAIYATVNAFVNPGDRVVVFEPLYDSYAQAVAQAGGVLVPIRLHAPDWRVDWDELDRARDAGFALLVLNSPHNPTGKVFDEDELARIAAALRATGAVALCDEVYEQMTYDGTRHVSLSSLPEVRDQVVRVSSAAKTFGFTGLKVGWATASPELSRAVRLVHQATVFSTTPFLQTAIAQVLEDDAWMARYTADLRTTYQAKRDLLTRALTGAGFDVPTVRGTYFVMASFARLAPGLTDVEMTRRLVEEKGVAAIPPSVFHARPPGPLPWLRFAFCKRDDTLALAAQRLGGADRTR
ncbi:MAG: aminotransferase class I/II-fold pyridoxal phosphate-dependent enzyme [Kofleriaceae bacterium]|nr:MAG: aminotransferase class I/II-fold pyridoxal phosphate-dependent enzyme [Kofleriaceae bacterium]MBZ0233458.1 aminotransferase class I/II-fold pyridoxal phosphate-dependent enzyme [Kofleriaceae bacterium]